MRDNIVDNKIYDFCFDIALHDATLQAAYMDTLDSLISIYEYLKSETKDYINCIMNTNKSIDSIITSEVICKIYNSEKLKSFNSERDGRQQFKYGNIQKLVNMTAKYMYISSYNNIHMKNRFKNCDCPIDSIISKKIYDKCVEENLKFQDKEHFPKEYTNTKKNIRSFFYYLSFSKLSESDYLFCQEMLRDYCELKKISPLEFDYKYWKEDSSIIVRL